MKKKKKKTLKRQKMPTKKSLSRGAVCRPLEQARPFFSTHLHPVRLQRVRNVPVVLREPVAVAEERRHIDHLRAAVGEAVVRGGELRVFRRSGDLVRRRRGQNEPSGNGVGYMSDIHICGCVVVVGMEWREESNGKVSQSCVAEEGCPAGMVICREKTMGHVSGCCWCWCWCLVAAVVVVVVALVVVAV